MRPVLATGPQPAAPGAVILSGVGFLAAAAFPVPGPDDAPALPIPDVHRPQDWLLTVVVPLNAALPAAR